MADDPYQHARRAALGARLRQLRQEAGLSERKVAKTAGISQSSVSRIENGEMGTSGETLDRIIAAMSVDAEAAEDLRDLLSVVHTEAESLRRYARRGFAAVQGQIGALERRTRLLRAFQPGLVPGLLQTAEYAFNVLSRIPYVTSADLTHCAQARMDRQAILYEPGRQFRFVLTESALLHWVCPPAVMLAQLDRLRELATLPTVHLGILPLDRPMPQFPQCGFTIYDNERAHVESHTNHTKLTAPADVALYASIHQDYEAAAVQGQQVDPVLKRVMQTYRERLANDA